MKVVEQIYKKKDMQLEEKLGNLISMIITYAGLIIIAYINVEIFTYIVNKLGIVGIVIGIGVLSLNFMLIIFVPIIIHESGHLIFGKLTGYKYVSYRIGPYMLIKNNGKLKMKRYNIKGIVGQCLLMPDSDWNVYEYPYVLYNIGGGLANLIMSILSLFLYLFFIYRAYISEMLIVFFIIGIISAVNNLIPMKKSGIPNDGYNIMSLYKDKQTRRSFYIQLYINGMLIKGHRLRDMPERFFENIGNDENINLNNPWFVSLEVLKCNYLHDKKEFEKAKEYSTNLIKSVPNLISVYKNELTCELLFYEIIGLCRQEKINRLYTGELKRYIRKTLSHVKRRHLIYAYEVLINNDSDKAIQGLDEFKSNVDIIKTYPYIGEIEAERELIEFIDNLAVVKNKKVHKGNIL